MMAPLTRWIKMPEDGASPTTRSTRLGLVVNLSLLIGSVLVAALAAELLIRLVAPQQLISIRPDVWQPADSVGYLLRANLRTTINTGEREVHLLTNAEGHRIGQRSGPTSGPRVLLMGDSFLAALQVEYAQSMAGLLEAQLPVHVGGPVRIDNGGVAGWGPVEYFYRTASLVGRESYDLILVVLYVANDVVSKPPRPRPPVTPVVYHQFRFPKGLTWGELVDAVLRPSNDFLETRSHLFVFTKARTKTLFMRIGLTPEYFPDEFRKSAAASERWSMTATICRDLTDVAAAAGVPTMFVLLPAPYQVDSAIFRQYVTGFGIDQAQVDLDQPSRLLREALEAEGLLVFDVLPVFREAHDQGVILYGRIDRHLSPEGHQLLADQILPWVSRFLRTP